ncbi:MAG: DUF1080 domain-containing protein [Pirellulaceae bacterium]
MRHFVRILLIFSGISVFSFYSGKAIGQVQDTPKPADSGHWIELFDGKTLTGWQAESNANWSVKDGEIRADSGNLSLLRTTSQFDQFELALEFQAAPNTNSGVFLWTSPKPTDPTVDCVEVNIVSGERHPYPTGSLVGRKRCEQETELSSTEWHQMAIHVSNKQIIIYVDSKRVCDYVPPSPLGRGFIGLQYNEGPIAFRNIRLRPLNLKSLVEDAEQEWTAGDESNTKWDFRDGKMSLVGGPGYISSKSEFADFVLQTRCQLATLESNSGIFFRCIAGEKLNGYECQLDNQIESGTTESPADFGTGGIYRRQAASRVIARPNEWFDLTIVACGPHISTWVNGQQTVDWTDTRPPDANPRRGLRREAGPVMLQAHDANTDVKFSGFSIREIDARNRK